MKDGPNTGNFVPVLAFGGKKSASHPVSKLYIMMMCISCRI